MNITEEMLEKAIEIEGLVRILRDGAASPETYALLERKCGELHSWAKSAADSVEPTPAKATPASIPESAMELEEADDMLMEEAEREETASEADDDILLTLDDDDEPEAAPEPASIPEPEPEPASLKQPESTPAPSPASSQPARPVKEDASDAGKAPNYKSRFSLNDRFLYARELFNGDMKMFDASIRAIEGVKDFSVVEDYFYNELDWNREDPTVKAFMDTLAGKASY